MLGATISNELRMRKLRKMSAQGVHDLGGRIDRLSDDLTQLVQSDQSEATFYKVEELVFNQFAL